MSNLKVSVNYWEYSDGEVEYVGKCGTYPTGWRKKRDKGFYCWAVPTNNAEFVNWTKENCPNSYIAKKFNSGNPMFVVFLPDEKDAMMFYLRWVQNGSNCS